jgi:hypothetical protein
MVKEAGMVVEEDESVAIEGCDRGLAMVPCGDNWLSVSTTVVAVVTC